MTKASLAILALCLAGGTPPTPSPQPTDPAAGTAQHLSPESSAGPVQAPAKAEPPAAAEQTPQGRPEPAIPSAVEQAAPTGGPPEPPEEPATGPSPGASTLTLRQAVRRALEQNFTLLDAGDAVTGARWQEKVAFGSFLPQVTPLFQRGEDRTIWGVDLAQALPWTGATLAGSGRYTHQPASVSPYPRTGELRLVLSQPLLRGLGPNATFYELRNARRARVGQERRLALARQALAVEVAQAFYGVIAARQLVDVSRQSLSRTETMLRSSEARLGVGMASKLDVFRAELQTQQARESMVRTDAALANALERFRAVLALGPGEPVEPEAAVLPEVDSSDIEPLEVLVRRALEARLEVVETRELVDDARRAASLARQNQLPQLDLNVGLNQTGYGGSFGDAWSAADRRVEVYLSASYPFQVNQQRATSALARLELGSRERGVRQREIEVEQQVRQAVRDLSQIQKSVELQQKAVDVAVQQRRLAVLRYQRGLGSNFEIGEAEAYLVQARSALVALLTQFALARLDLKRATGTLDVETEFPR